MYQLSNGQLINYSDPKTVFMLFVRHQFRSYLYSGDLNTKLCIQMVEKKLDAKLFGIQIPFEYLTNERRLHVYLCNGPVFKLQKLGIQMSYQQTSANTLNRFIIRKIFDIRLFLRSNTMLNKG